MNHSDGNDIQRMSIRKDNVGSIYGKLETLWLTVAAQIQPRSEMGCCSLQKVEDLPRVGKLRNKQLCTAIHALAMCISFTISTSQYGESRS